MLSWLSRLLPAPNKECEHDWDITYVHRRTLVPRERRCKKCGLEQVAVTLWKNKVK